MMRKVLLFCLMAFFGDDDSGALRICTTSFLQDVPR